MPNCEFCFILKRCAVIDNEISLRINKKILWDLDLKVTVGPDFINFLHYVISSVS